MLYSPEGRREGLAGHRDHDDFFIFPKHQELLGDRAKDCGVKISLEWTGMESEARGNLIITYILYRCVSVCVYLSVCVCLFLTGRESG